MRRSNGNDIYNPPAPLASRDGVDWHNFFVVASADDPPLEFRISRRGAHRSRYLKELLGASGDADEDDHENDMDEDVEGEAQLVVAIPHVKGATLRHVVGFCERYRTRDPPCIPRPLEQRFEDTPGLSDWDIAFAYTALVTDHDDGLGYDEEHGALVDVLMAAGLLEIDPLVDLTSAALAGLMRHRSVQQIRELFAVDSDLTRAEEEQLARDTCWVDPYMEISS